MQITHVIFDMDGTLLDSGLLYLDVSKDIVAAFDREWDADFHATTVGRRHDENAPAIIKHYGLDITVDQFMEEYRKRIVPKLGEGGLRFLFFFRGVSLRMSGDQSSLIISYEISGKLYKYQLFFRRTQYFFSNWISGIISPYHVSSL